MNRLVLVLAAITLMFTHAYGQAKTRRLPGIINHQSSNLSAPYMSFDGNALLFVSNDGEDGALTVSYTSRETDWVQPVILPKQINHRLIYLRGFGLSANGKKMYFTATKAPIIGGYDIMVSELNGSKWSEPQNILLPINSKTNDGCPSLTPDETAIYFMRCDKMDQSKASGCKIFSSKKKPTGQWEEPIELPSSINTGNSQTPRIMADGETLIFSSDKMGTSQGGMDLYYTKLKDGKWSDPKPMDFINTPADDQFVSVAALGRYIVKEAPGQRKNTELVEFLIPEDIRPRGVMKVEGFIRDPNNKAVPCYIAMTDLTTNKRAFSGRPNAEGNYMFYIMEGTRYEMSVDPEQSNVGFYGRIFDLTSDKIPQRERVNVILKQPAINDEFPLALVAFKPGTAELESTSDAEIKRLIRLAKAYPQLIFEIQVSMKGYVQDSLRTNPDLTEMLVDSLKIPVASVDSSGQMLKRDSLVLKQLFHNDRTVRQAQSIIGYIVGRGGDPNAFSFKTTAIPATTPEETTISIKAVVKQR
ncbi:MAG: hypothetical protein ABIS36_13790 [Chryseolinea sp.]